MLAIETYIDRLTGTHIMRLVGEADLHGAQMLEHSMDKVLSQHPHAVVIDLSAVRYMGSPALGLMLEFQTSLDAAGAVLDLVGPRPNLAAFLRFIHLDTVLSVHDSIADALNLVPR
ncbi:MAG: STAS domain-containing protein [Phycisphaerales bacterium]